MVFSMTGYAMAFYECSEGAFSLELKSVNSRYLDLVFRFPDEFRAYEQTARNLISSTVTRGKLECRLNWSRSPMAGKSLAINNTLFARLLDFQANILDKSPESAALSVHDFLNWPGLIGEEDHLSEEMLREAVLNVLNMALTQFTDSRAREGVKLKQVLLERLSEIDRILAHIGPIVPQIAQIQAHRLRARLKEAMEADIDDDRIHQEVVLLANRGDVAEEVSRLKVHASEVRRILDHGGVVGKRLDFMMQELNREANTLGSKSVLDELSKAAIDLKLLIEQMREQIQNLE